MQSESATRDELVTVVMPAFETEQFIGEAIRSVRNQTYANFELLIVDDCSRDDTLEKARTAAGDDRRIRIITMEQNSGAAACRNRAIDEARGEYIAFLDSDDLWHREKLARHLSFMKDNAAGFSYTDYEVINEKGEDLSLRSAPQRITYSQLLRCCPIGCLTVMIDLRIVGDIRMAEMRKRQDWATWLRVLRRGVVGYGLNETLASYRLREGSLSFRKSSLFKPIWTLYRRDQGLSVARSLYYIALYSTNGVLRKYVPGFAGRIGFL